MRFFIPLFLLTCTLFTSCTIHKPGLWVSSPVRDKDYQVVDRIEGNARAVYVFGIGGNTHGGLTEEARETMLFRYPLQENEELANVTVDSYTKHRILYAISVCEVAADIVTLDKGDLTARKKELETLQIGDKNDFAFFEYQVGNKIYVKVNDQLQEAVISEFYPKGVRCFYFDEDGGKQTRRVNKAKVFDKRISDLNKERYGFQIDEEATVTPPPKDGEPAQRLKVNVLAVSEWQIFVKPKQGKPFFVNQTDIFSAGNEPPKPTRTGF